MPSILSALRNLPALVVALRANTAIRQQELNAGRAFVFLNPTDRLLLNNVTMKLSELMPELGSLRAQLSKVFGEQQKLIDELKLKVEDLQGRAGDLPEDAAGVLGEIRSLVKSVDDLIPDVSQPGDIDLGAAPKPAVAPAQPLEPQAPEGPQTSEELQDAYTIPQLDKLAADEGIDISGVTLKSDIADAIVAGRKAKG